MAKRNGKTDTPKSGFQITLTEILNDKAQTTRMQKKLADAHTKFNVVKLKNISNGAPANTREASVLKAAIHDMRFEDAIKKCIDENQLKDLHTEVKNQQAQIAKTDATNPLLNLKFDTNELARYAHEKPSPDKRQLLDNALKAMGHLPGRPKKLVHKTEEKKALSKAPDATESFLLSQLSDGNGGLTNDRTLLTRLASMTGFKIKRMEKAIPRLAQGKNPGLRDGESLEALEKALKSIQTEKLEPAG